MSPAAGIVAAASEVQEKLSAAGFRFCLIGGLALQRWGQPRYTQDIDLSLLCPYGDEVAVAGRLAALLQPRIANAVDFSAESRVFLAVTSGGVPVDIAFAGIDFERRCLERASVFDFGGVTLRTCSAEDLVVMKAFAGRLQDWVDIAAIVIRQEALDWDLIERELKPLLAVKGTEGSWDRLAALRPRR